MCAVWSPRDFAAGRSLRPLATACVLVLLLGGARAADTAFDGGFLRANGSQGIDLSRFNKPQVVVAGQYVVDVYVNEMWRGKWSLEIRPGSELPCVDASLLSRFGVDLLRLEGGKEILEGASLEKKCLGISQLVPGASMHFNMEDLRLDASIPQAFTRRAGRVIPEESQLDGGISALALNYALSATRMTGGATSSDHLFLGLNGAANFGLWRYRHTGSLQMGSAGRRRYQTTANSLARDILPLRAQLVLGATTSSSLGFFESAPLCGARIESDDRMLPDEARGYTPTVRGVARSQARVAVRQQGRLIYESVVPPGPFEFSDVFAAPNGGDLQISVTEADGGTQEYTVSHATVPNLVRKGVLRYSAAAGMHCTSGWGRRGGALLAAGVQYGVADELTLYGSLTAAKNYSAIQVGAATNTPIGAFSADVTQSRADLHRSGRTGQSLRLGFSRFLDATNTNVVLATYRSSSEHYTPLNEGLARVPLMGESSAAVRQRTQFQFGLTQNLGSNLGQLYLSGFTRRFWSSGASNMQYQLGYGRNFGPVHVSVNVSHVRSAVAGASKSNRFYLGVTLPFGSLTGESESFLGKTSVSSAFTKDRDSSSWRVSAGGVAGRESELSYNVYYNDSGAGSTRRAGGLSGTYRTPLGTISGSASQSGQFSHLSVGANGALVAHEGGVTFAGMAGETMALVVAPGASGARVSDTLEAVVDARGYAVVPSLAPYRENVVELDPKGLPLDVEFENTRQVVAPRAGAIVRLNYSVKKTATMYLKIKKHDGGFVPFGAAVFDADGTEVGVVGQAGQAVARKVGPMGDNLIVRWGPANDEACLIHHLPLSQHGGAAYMDPNPLDATCQSARSLPTEAVLPPAPRRSADARPTGSAQSRE